MDVVFSRHTGHTGRETRWGLRLAGWALLLQLVAILLGAVAAVVFQILLQDAFGSAFSFYFFLSLPTSLLYVASAIIFLVGFSAMYRHRGEPGSVRHEGMRKSLLFLLALIVALVIQWAVTVFLPAFFPPAFNPDEFQAFLTVRSVLAGSVGIIVAILLAFFLYFVVASLVPANRMSRLKLAVVLMVLGGITTFALSLLALWTTFPQEFNGVFVAPSALAVFLFWSVYRASQRSPNLVPGDPDRDET